MNKVKICNFVYFGKGNERKKIKNKVFFVEINVDLITA